LALGGVLALGLGAQAAEDAGHREVSAAAVSAAGLERSDEVRCTSRKVYTIDGSDKWETVCPGSVGPGPPEPPEGPSKVLAAVMLGLTTALIIIAALAL